MCRVAVKTPTCILDESVIQKRNGRFYIYKFHLNRGTKDLKNKGL